MGAQNIQDNTGIIQDHIQDVGMSIQDLVNGYAVFRLEADLSHFSENAREVVRLLIEACDGCPCANRSPAALLVNLSPRATRSTPSRPA